MPHSPALRTASTRYIVIPPSFFAHASQAGQSSRPSSVRPDNTSPVRNEDCVKEIVLIILQIKMSFASQQAARLAQQRVAKQDEALTQGTTTKVSSMASSTPSTTSSFRTNCMSASSTSPPIPSSSSQRSQDIGQMIKTLRNLEDRLDDLLSKFQVLEDLDISPHLDSQYLYHYSQNGLQKHLSITSQNFPLVALRELLRFEQELCFVEAHGNKDIEVRRKNVANRIKETTAYLDKIIQGTWWIAHSKRT
ncbi:hypothetical protein C0993_000168 [Termitomyces sp. T159_Od127]|nr:hypothetical protein C0993_000168 [Termitomyces sp. T159_Od127]